MTLTQQQKITHMTTGEFASPVPMTRIQPQLDAGTFDDFYASWSSHNEFVGDCQRHGEAVFDQPKYKNPHTFKI